MTRPTCQRSWCRAIVDHWHPGHYEDPPVPCARLTGRECEDHDDAEPFCCYQPREGSVYIPLALGLWDEIARLREALADSQARLDALRADL